VRRKQFRLTVGPPSGPASFNDFKGDVPAYATSEAAPESVLRTFERDAVLLFVALAVALMRHHANWRGGT
jgi:hypothetical protein